MSTPAPVPSKAAIHALRGLLFGTSCSIALLAEERSRRIAVARSAVENGRKLKSAKRYSTSGNAALAALQNEAAADSFVGWSFSSGSSAYSQNLEPLSSGHLELGRLNDLGPDPRNSRIRPSIKGQPSTPESSPRTSAKKSTSTPQSPKFGQDEKSATQSLSASQTRLQRGGLPRDRRIIPLYSEFPARHVRRTSLVAVVLEDFWKRNSTIDLVRQLQHVFDNRQSVATPNSIGLELVRRAYESLGPGHSTPVWLLRLSQSLSVACQSEGEYETALDILDVLVDHGQIGQRDYLAHQPFEAIRYLLRQGSTRSALDEPHHKFKQCLERAQRIFFMNVVEESHCRADAQPAVIARDIASGLVRSGCPEAAINAFQTARTLCDFGISTIEWFILLLREHNHHAEAIDVFVSLSGTAMQLVSPSWRIFERMYLSVLKTNGYCIIEVLRTMQRLYGTTNSSLDGSWIARIIRSYWANKRDYAQTRRLFHDVQNLGNIHNDYAVHSVMVQISLEAEDMELARVGMEELHSRFSEAKTDVKLISSFTRYHAKSGDWHAVWAVFEGLNVAKPFNGQQQQEYDAAFQAVFEEFASHHTLGEMEQFLEEYSQNLGITLNHGLVDRIVERHGKCRDFEALLAWLKFSREHGFTTNSLFWSSLFLRCKENWFYNKDQVVNLFNTLKSLKNFHIEFPQGRELVRHLANVNLTEVRTFRVRNPTTLKPGNEQTTFDRMKGEAQKGQWGGVLASYKRAVHNGMGFSSRCLTLAVTSCIKLYGSSCKQAMSLLHKAQLAGNDIARATVPLILAELDQIRMAADNWEGTGDAMARPSPYRSIEALFRKLQQDGLHLDDALYHRAAQICTLSRNWREVIDICVSAAQSNGSGDLCYNVWNFTHLSQALVARHEYGKLEWLLNKVLERPFRTWRSCRRSLKTTVRYLQRASEADKEARLIESDLSMLEFAQEILRKVSEEKSIMNQRSRQQFDQLCNESDGIQSASHVDFPFHEERSEQKATKTLVRHCTNMVDAVG